MNEKNIVELKNISVTFDGEECLYRMGGNGSKTGLGIGNGHTNHDLEYAAGDVVAHTAARRNMGQAEIPAAENDLVRSHHLLRACFGVGWVMLVVTVHGDDTGGIRAVLQEPGEGGFQRRALSTVDFVMQQVHFRVCGGSFKVVEIFRFAAVVD